METKRMEIAKKRLRNKIDEVNKYLEEKPYNVNELSRLGKNFEKKRMQFEKDFNEFKERFKDKDDMDDTILECEELITESDDIQDDLNHFIELENQQQKKDEQERQQQQEMEKLRQQYEMEEGKREREMKNQEMEMERKKQDQQYDLERMRIESEIEKEKIKAESTFAVLEREKKNTTKTHTVKLPKLELKKFSGQTLKWQEFWDTFEATIHKNDTLQPIDKFNYLRAQLENDALKSIEGLELTNANYEAAVEILKERYGNVQLIIDNHYMQLSDMQVAFNKTSSLRSTYDSIEKHLRSLQALGEDVNQRHIISTMKRKFPKVIIARLEQQKDTDKEWTVQMIRKSLKSYITAQEIADHNQPTSSHNSHGPKTEEFKKPYHPPSTQLSPGTTGAMFTNGKVQNATCIFCKKRHWSDECRTVSTLIERKEKLKGRCYICLQPRHKGKCKVEKSCYHCKKNDHHRSLCPSLFERSRNGTSSAMITNDTQEESTLIEEEGLLSAGENVIMQTALVEAMDKEQLSSEVTRVLMDTGSSRTYVSENIVKKLKLKTEDSNRLTIYTFGVTKPKELLSPIVTLVLKSKDGNTITIKANVVPKISGQINRHPVHLEDKLLFQRRFKLADTLPTNREASTIGVLIGNDYYNEVMTGEKTKIQEGLFAMKSKFGWIISGRTKTTENVNVEDNNFFAMTHSSSHILPEIQQFTATDDSLPTTPNIDEFWKLETIGIAPTELDKDVDNQIIMESFKDQVEIKDNRYHVTWPWKNEETNLPENYELCVGRLRSLHKRLADIPETLQKYDNIIKDQLAKEIIERVDKDTDQGDRRHYIPHHGVFTPWKDTTKIRIVYDASAKTKKSNKSLNECLHRGPVILEDICGLLMRFRTNKIGITADIEKAFLQVALKPEERDVTRFLWLKDINKPPSADNIVTYRFTRVPFGVISSPFLLGATIKHHLEQSNQTEHSKLSNDMYVDNLITGADTEDEARQLYTTSKKKFNEISMNLRDWKTNSEELNDSFKGDEMKGSVIKVLGLQWNTLSDEFAISTEKFERMETATTKRQVLTTLASLFDPLGYLTPATMKMKLFLQRLWSNGIDWDDTMEQEDINAWKRIMDDTKELSKIVIPRHVGKRHGELICFCDASKDSYATAIYLKTEIDGESSVNLIFSKSRIAPKKTMSIPRLELMAILIGVRSLNFVSKELGLSENKKTLWTDSQCVLNWLKSKKQLSVFVRNRITEITNETNIEFRYINTKHNPADIPSRGMSSKKLKKNDLWWHGPKWLKKNADQWPNWDVKVIDKQTIEKIQSEVKGSKVLYETSIVANAAQNDRVETNENNNQTNEPPFEISLEDYSSINDVLRITAYANRFLLKTMKKSTIKGELKADEIEVAKILWTKYLQKKHYLTEVNGKVSLNKKTATNQLNPRIDPDGIVRCYGRFTNADLPQETITPILLPRKERFVQLIIEDVHRKLFHAGVSHTLSQLRTKYWILQGRAEVKYILKRCRICRKHQGGPYKMPQMSPWPKSKLSRSTPFEKTGLDYFGPLYVKREDGQGQKVWVCLFTCVVVRAIHLELVNDLTAEEFIMALRRFIARRGKPSQIISDNASQFKLSKSTIDLAWKKAVTDPTVKSYVADQGINWTFIIELSPWMGGFYERLVGSSKMALKKSIGKKHLTSLQLQTYLAETEAILNSRPLVYVSEDLNDSILITPSHFVSPNSKTGTPTLENQEEINDPDYVEEKKESREVLLDTWKKGQRLLETFWNIWRNDYLLSLRERTKSKLTSPRIQAEETPNVGDIVQLKEDLPRGSWKLGKIVELITSNDGNVRAAKVLLTTKNIVNRPLNLLYPLECEKNFTNEKETTTTIEEEAQNNDERKEIHNDEQQPANDESKPIRRSTRRAAFEARDKIYGQNLQDE